MAASDRLSECSSVGETEVSLRGELGAGADEGDEA